MQKLHEHFSTKITPQSQPIPGTDQIKMPSGGYGWKVSDQTVLDRFLILGTEGGTYYVSEQKLTRGSATTILKLIASDGVQVVKRVVEISQAGRAPKNDPALFVLAMAAKLGNEETKRAAYQALPQVARIGTHLFHFLEYAKGLGNLGGNGFKRALARWYNDKEVDRLAYQMIKYQQRDGWSHKDALRLGHPKPATPEHESLFLYAINGRQKELSDSPDSVPENLRQVWAFERLKSSGLSLKDALLLIRNYRLPHECIPNDLKNKPEVWEAMLENMPLGAVIRNLAKMSSLGMLHNSASVTRLICDRLTDVDIIKSARLHPIAYLFALTTYVRGAGVKGKLTWDPCGKISDALSEGFVRAFGAVEPTHKRICIALDVSGSMGSAVLNSHLTCRQASAAMALVSMSVEENYEVLGFTAGSHLGNRSLKGTNPGGWYRQMGGITPLNISPKQRLDDIIDYIKRLDFGATDCSLPMRWATEYKIPFDAFIIFTDGESWAGPVHVTQALGTYRQKMGIEAKLISVAMAGGDFSVANAADPNQVDVIGFDSNTPHFISQFISD